ncbi:MAG: UDP-glucose--dolichyl-phosphate glucosyltransferase, partial [Bacteroidetes bacterium QS_1_65_9]
GLRVREVPASYRRRTGVSKITGTITGTIKASAKILWTIFRMAATRGQRSYRSD